MQTEEQIDLGVGQTAELADLAASTTEPDQFDGLDIETFVDATQTQFALLIGESVERTPDTGLMLALIDDILGHGLDGTMQGEDRGIGCLLILSQLAQARLQGTQPRSEAHSQPDGRHGDEQCQCSNPEWIDQQGLEQRQSVHHRASGIVVDESLTLSPDGGWRAVRLFRSRPTGLASSRAPILQAPIGHPPIVLTPISLTALAHTPIAARTIVLAAILRTAFTDTALPKSTLGESALTATTLVALSTTIGTATQQPDALLLQPALAIIAQRPRGRLGLNGFQVSDTFAHGSALETEFIHVDAYRIHRLLELKHEPWRTWPRRSHNSRRLAHSSSESSLLRSIRMVRPSSALVTPRMKRLV